MLMVDWILCGGPTNIYVTLLSLGGLAKHVSSAALKQVIILECESSSPQERHPANFTAQS